MANGSDMRRSNRLRPIVVRIDPATEPLEGTVQPPGARAVEFVGYMQLVAQIERNRETARGYERAQEHER